MQHDENEFQIRQIPAGSPQHLPALHLAMSVEPPHAADRPQSSVANLLSGSRRGTVSIDLLFGAFDDRQLISACVAVESPGAAAMVFAPTQLGDRPRYRATVGLLRALQNSAWRRSLALLEVLLPLGDQTSANVLREAGYTHLTRLVYLRRENAETVVSAADVELSWVQYLPERETHFAEVLEETYTQSQDCPELTSLRSTADVLAGHRATEHFDPTLWWVAQRRGRSAGILLLNRIPAAAALEVEYVGVVPPARGTGVSDTLMARAVAAAEASSVTSLALAVDCRNTPARRWYARWGFLEVGAREAWIASPKEIRT